MRFKKLHPNAKQPTYGTVYSAGADLYACEGAKDIMPGDTVVIHTGIALEIPTNHVGLIFARSGLATKRGLAPANKVGVIDSDYRGEIKIVLHNHSRYSQSVEQGERVAQLLVIPYGRVYFEEVEELTDTERGNGGFGSTGEK